MAKRKQKKKKNEAATAAPNWDAATVTMWKIGKIIPYDRNPRTHPEAQVELLAELMKKFGPDQPIVVDENGVILKGHGRLLAAQRAGFETFPVAQHMSLTEEEKRAVRIADNQVALLSAWDHDQIKVEIAEIALAGFDMKLLGFSEAQLEEFAAGGPGSPVAFTAYGEDIDTKYRCPSCGFAWSGSPEPGKGKDDTVRMRVQGKPDSNRRQGSSAAVPAAPSLARKAAARKSAPAKQKRKNRKKSSASAA